jgi:hypothetical protein
MPVTNRMRHVAGAWCEQAANDAADSGDAAAHGHQHHGGGADQEAAEHGRDGGEALHDLS